MTETLIIISVCIAFLAAGILLYFLTPLFRAFFKMSTETNNRDRLITDMEHLDDTIRASIAVVNRHMVDAMREKEEFTQLDKEEAFVYCKTRVLQSTSKETLKNLENTYGDIQRLINNRIESLLWSEKR